MPLIIRINYLPLAFPSANILLSSENFILMTCPVCKHESIPSLVRVCPNCSSSLVGLVLLDTLEEQYVDILKGKMKMEGKQIQQNKIYEQQIARKKKWNLLLLTLLLALPLLYYFCAPNKPLKKKLQLSKKLIL